MERLELMRELLTPALSGGPTSGILRRRPLLQPEPELAQRMGQAPFVENSSGHGEGGAGQFRGLAAQRIIEQPFFKGFRLRIVFDRSLQQRPLDRKSEGVGRLIPFAFSSASFRGFECRQQGPAHIGRAKRVHDFRAKKPRLAPLSVTVIPRGNPGPGGRAKPCSMAATSRSTLARSSSITAPGAQPLSLVKVLTYPRQRWHASITAFEPTAFAPAFSGTSATN